jgi:hypothetical protein
MKLKFSNVDELEGFRFNSNDHCRLAILVDPEMCGGSFTWFLEIHDPGDRVPAHLHHDAIEAFFVLRGEVIFHTDEGAILLLHLLMLPMILKIRVQGAFI